MPQKNEYTYSQMQDMQRDAINRVNQMWKQSQQKIQDTQAAFSANKPSPALKNEHTNNFSNNNNSNNHQQNNFFTNNSSSMNNPQNSNNHKPEINEPPIEVQSHNESPFKDFISKLGLDDETIILLMLLLMLVNEGADVTIIMALVYILL